MNILLAGYGYCAYYVAKNLLQENHNVFAFSRNLHSFSIEHKNFQRQSIDLLNTSSQKIPFDKVDIVYYFIPPYVQENNDLLLVNFLNLLMNTLPQHIVYFGSSGIYGDHQGDWIDENTSLHINNSLQKNRFLAEQTLKDFCVKNNISLSLLRIAGIYGPNRLIKETSTNITLPNEQEAPYTNYIYVRDLALIASKIIFKNHGIETYNISDGVPQKFGAIKKILFQQKIIEFISYIPFFQYYEASSSMTKYFLSSSKKVNNNKIKKILNDFNFTPLEKGVLESI